jgi:hypothetical protein
MNIKQRLDNDAYKELEALIKKTIDIRHIKTKEEFEITKKALELLMNWLNSVYEIDREKEIGEPDDVLDKMFKINN